MSEHQEQDRFPSLESLEAQFDRLAADEISGRTAPKSLRFPGWAPVAAAIGLAIIGLAFLTPPGRSAAEAVARFAGIGDEPSLGVGEGERAVVIGTGDDAESFRYEVVARSRSPETCISVEFPTLVREDGATVVAQCLTSDTKAELAHASFSGVTYPAPAGLPPDAQTLVQGLALPEISHVSMTYERDGQPIEVPVSVSTLDRALADQIGTSDETRFFIAFLPPGVAPSDVEIGGQDTQGADVFRANLGQVAHGLNFGPGGSIPSSG
jgi:hypothetical protein